MTSFHDGKLEDFQPIFEHLIKGGAVFGGTPRLMSLLIALQKTLTILMMMLGVKPSFQLLSA
jgi:hypothetical protein